MATVSDTVYVVSELTVGVLKFSVSVVVGLVNNVGAPAVAVKDHEYPVTG